MLSKLWQAYQFVHTIQAHYHQSLAWEDAEKMRIARERAEEQSAAQVKAMLDANPSGQLGASTLDDRAALERAGLL